MHPIHFILRGVISADFPGEASHRIEASLDNHAVTYRAALTRGTGPVIQTVRRRDTAAEQASPEGFIAQQASAQRKAVPPVNLAVCRKTASTGESANILRTVIGSSAVRVMRESMRPTHRVRTWAAQEKLTCPGRTRLKTANLGRGNVLPIVMALVNGAERHLRFQSIGSRLKPGCAEARIVSQALALMRRPGE